MENLSNLTIAKKVMLDQNFRTKKKFGQNFLMDENVLNNIVDAADINKNDLVIEIGPGIGTLSQKILERAHSAILIEIDEKLIPILNDTLKEYSNFRILNEDIMKLDLNSLFSEGEKNLNIKIVANLPYYITTPVLTKLMKSHLDYESITIMIQKEVADRLIAKKGNKDYGAITLLVDFYTNPKIIEFVTKDKFFPRPKVDSAVVDLKKKETKLPEGLTENMLFTVIRAAFLHRRKTLYNGLLNCKELNLSKEKIKLAISKSGWEDGIRGEKLSLFDYIKLSQELYKMDF